MRGQRPGDCLSAGIRGIRWSGRFFIVANAIGNCARRRFGSGQCGVVGGENFRPGECRSAGAGEGESEAGGGKNRRG